MKLTATGPGGSVTKTATTAINVVAAAPVANFTMTPASGTAPLNVTFSNTTTGSVTSWLWNFGDNTTSNLQSPSHTYSAPGSYTVKLTATGPGGSVTKTATTAINVVAAAPVANFTMTPASGTAPLSVAFTNTSSGSVTTYSWNLGDGTTSTQATPPSHVYSVAGMYTITLTAIGPGGSETKTASVTVNVAPTKRDFNGDGKADLLWRQTSTGTTTIWQMNGASASDVGRWVMDKGWVIQDVGDFNGDGKADILWRETSTGAVTIWQMNGAAGPLAVGNWVVDKAWVVQGIGDFNGDGKADILWRQKSTEAVTIWQMNGAAGPSTVGNWVMDHDWVVQGVGDFNGDGKADILWRQTSTGATTIWQMNGASSSAVGGWVVDKDWGIQGVGDFNGDGKADILWRQTSTGAVTIWQMNGGASASAVGNWAVDNDWVIQGIGDFNGDGKADIVWRQADTGSVTIWQMNGGGSASAVGDWVVPGDWVIQDQARLR